MRVVYITDKVSVSALELHMPGAYIAGPNSPPEAQMRGRLLAGGAGGVRIHARRDKGAALSHAVRTATPIRRCSSTSARRRRC
jgi:hypothetical protein